MKARRAPKGRIAAGKGSRFVWDLGPVPSCLPGGIWRKSLQERQMPMRKVALSLAFVLLAGQAFAAERYEVAEKGGFASTGRRVEFASRYSWQSYEVDYRFGLDMETRRITKRSKLKLTITRRDGSRWSYTCKASKGRKRMWANVNRLYSKGVSVMTECRIPHKKFAKAVDLDPGLVGDPVLVFHVMVKDGEASPAIQKGMYFMNARDAKAGSMAPYASGSGDPSDLGVLFASDMAPSRYHPNFVTASRYVP